MEWLDGVPLLLADFQPRDGKDSREERREIVNLLVRAFFQQIYIDGFFHADPHPGNLFYLNDGRVALIDCGMVGRLDPRTQQVITELLLAIVNLDSQRCTQLTLELAEPIEPVNLARLESDYDRLLRRYYNRSLAQINFSQLLYEVLQAARANQLRVPGNMGLYAKTLANLEGVARKLDPEFNLPEQVKPLMTDLFRRQLVGEAPLQALLRTALDLKSLGLQSPRQLELLLDRVTSETLQWQLTLRDLEGVRHTVDTSANRLSFSILVGALIIGAAIISANAQISQVSWISNVLFAAASLLGLWLIVSILRSGRFR
jgi:predicted unusual protein kinase regulating ubiquinone biosynthesis (AarF/ABC1/UbiB family)